MSAQQRWWRAAALAGCVGFLGGLLGLSTALASGAARPASFGADLGPVYVAGFTARVPSCAEDPDCVKFNDDPGGVYYEVWLFRRGATIVASQPRVDRLLRLTLREEIVSQ